MNTIQEYVVTLKVLNKIPSKMYVSIRGTGPLLKNIYGAKLYKTARVNSHIYPIFVKLYYVFYCMQSVEKKIEKSIMTKPKGALLLPDDFAQEGSAESVRKALQNIKEKGLIKSVAHGIYVRPEISEYIGEVLPTAEDVARTIAKRDKIKLVPTGVYALHALGLSTQVPLNLVFLTDGSPRIIKVGKRTIKLKKTTPKNLKAKGEISSLVIQALREIGKDKATDEEISTIMALLKKENKKVLQHDITLAPEWIKKIMKQALDE